MKVALSAGYFWLVMLTYYILKPVRDSLFLGEQGIRELPVAHLLNLAVTLVSVQLYVALSRRLSRRDFALVVNLGFLATIGLFWGLLGPLEVSQEWRKSLAWVYFAFVSSFAVFSVTLLWSLTHATFDLEEGERWYGWIGSGGTLGALCGGWLTRTQARALGTENLLALAVLCYLPCAALGWVLGRRADQAVAAEAIAMATTPAASPELDAPPSALDLIRRNPYLAALATLVFLKLAVSVTKDYQLQEIVAAGFLDDQDGRTAYFGGVYQWTNVLGLFLGLCVTGPVQLRWGALPGLMTYPLAALATALGLFLAPSIEVAFWLAVVSQACAYSIFQWSQELLYQRTSAEEKLVAKGFIDTFVFRLGTAAAATLILGVASLGDRGWLDPAPVLMWALVGFGLLLLGMAWRLGRRFSALGEGSA